MPGQHNTPQLMGSLKGHLLIAMPGLTDPNFHQTVTFICEHTKEGAIGIVLNRIHSLLSGKDIFEELKLEAGPGAESIPVHIGGPVSINEIFVLHGPPFEWEGCFQVGPSIAMSNTIDILSALSSGSGPKSFLISLGCAGWGPGQLEDEIKQNAWLTSALLKEIVFDIPVEMRWQTAVKKMGIDPTLLSNTAGHA
ncbi:MAG: YqgE/AlgH family protein [Deltaproteobacteria bacterium]|nr:YqgE/AlgH family protein [Deltaproteobacteria bacterium]MBW1994843.1 YqgE/AlgH family protein [Deltaproteobacteria bacterium]MBW2150924.1 YqgE/AlgH family protein [Deltaproteobacteria bacterium]